MVDLHWIVLLPVLMGILFIVIPMKLARILVVVFQFFMVIANIGNFIYVKETGPWVVQVGGWPEYIGITLRADPLASVMVMVTSLLFFALFVFNVKKSFTDNMFLFLFLSLSGLI